MDRRKIRAVPLALGAVSVLVMVGLATLFSTTTMREKVANVVDANALSVDLHERFPYLKHLQCLDNEIHLKEHEACMRAYKCCTGPSMNCVPDMADFYGKQCRSCMQTQAPEYISDNQLKQNFADVCWVEVVDACRMVCPRNEPAGHLGHFYCLDCLEKESKKVKRWDINMATAIALKLRQREKESAEHLQAAIDEERNRKAREARMEQMETNPTADDLRRATGAKTSEERKKAFEEHANNEQKKVNQAQKAYNELTQAVKKALAKGDAATAAKLERAEQMLRREIKSTEGQAGAETK